MGAIADCTREHLATSDKAIIANRRMLTRAIKTVQAGVACRRAWPTPLWWQE